MKRQFRTNQKWLLVVALVTILGLVLAACQPAAPAPAAQPAGGGEAAAPASIRSGIFFAANANNINGLL